MANLRIAELDFDEIKQNLKTFLKAQNEFTDYDFDGSGLSVLIDILAYNTHYNAYLANMLINESFLDSAVKRSSAVSIAKHLGYTPRSARASTAVINIAVIDPIERLTTLTLPAYTAFSLSDNQTTLTYYNTEPYTASASESGYIFNNVKVKEGQLYEYGFTVVNPGPSEKYVLPSKDIDTTTLTVIVQNSSTDLVSERYELAEDIIDINNLSSAYFLEENPSEFYQIYFGDGIISKKLSPGNIIRVQYLITKGVSPNASSTIQQEFTAVDSIGGASVINITTVTNSSGGAQREEIDSIRFNAIVPRTQNRLVTKNDYKVTILNKYPEVESISVWGGEENDPPVYGKVFISLKPYSNSIIDDTVKDSIINETLRDRAVLTVRPEFVEPEYLYLMLNITVKYNPAATIYTAAQLKETLQILVRSFASDNLQKFEKNYYNSQLDKLILETDPSFISVNKKISVQRRIEPLLNTKTSFIGNNKLKFSNPLLPGTIKSTSFITISNNIFYTATIVDLPDTMPPSSTGTGTLQLRSADGLDTYLGDIGTINYGTGDIELVEVLVTGYPLSLDQQYLIQIYAELGTTTTDVISGVRQIIEIDSSRSSAVSGRVAGLIVDLVQ